MEKSIKPESGRYNLDEWIAEQDSQINAAVEELASNEPNIFSSQEQIIEHLSRIAMQAGKRELLDDLIKYTKE